jgi:hypothetical protein
MLLWILAWQRGSRLATGIAIGAGLALICIPVVRAIESSERMPLWVPPFPFALIAFSLFGFGLLAWFWGEE